MRPGRRGSIIALAAAVVAAALAGCVDAATRPSSLDGATAGSNPWERGDLATYVETPALAPRRSAAEREADVAPPGDPRFAAFDALMARYMEQHGITAAGVAVLRDGTLRYQNGYGVLDAAGTTPTPPDAMFRIASVTKPVTAALVAMLVEEGRMAWDDPVFCLPPQPADGCLLPVAPHPKRPVVDARLADVTLRDLVEHRTGWTRGPCTAPISNGMPLYIAEELGGPTPAPSWRLAQWFMGTPMDFDPGTDPDLDRYCNMGYTILGLVAEAATGATLGALYEAYLFRPLDVSGHIEPGETLPERRNPREPTYACDAGMHRSVFRPDEYVCAADGAFDLRGFLPGGGLVATAAAVGAIYEVFDNDGSPRSPGLLRLSGHTGSIPGTSTAAIRLSVGGESGADMQVVVLFNKRDGREPLESAALGPGDYHLLHAELLALFGAAESSTDVA